MKNYISTDRQTGSPWHSKRGTKYKIKHIDERSRTLLTVCSYSTSLDDILNWIHDHVFLIYLNLTFCLLIYKVLIGCHFQTTKFVFFIHFFSFII